MAEADTAKGRVLGNEVRWVTGANRVGLCRPFTLSELGSHAGCRAKQWHDFTCDLK